MHKAPTVEELRKLVPTGLDEQKFGRPEWMREWIVIGYALEFTAMALEEKEKASR